MLMFFKIDHLRLVSAWVAAVCCHTLTRSNTYFELWEMKSFGFVRIQNYLFVAKHGTFDNFRRES
jgi:hypothetical protein